VAPKELAKPVAQFKSTEDVVKSTIVSIVLALAGTLHLILVQVPEVPDKVPVFGTETT
jgi:hypothetical protein